MGINIRDHVNLLVGFLISSAVIVLLMMIVTFLGTKGMFNPQYELMTIFDNGIGIRKGTAVLYQGVKIGSVRKINLIQVEQKGLRTPSSKVAVKLEVDQKYKLFITKQSIAYVMRDQNMVSDRVINIESPEWSTHVLQDKDTIRSTTNRDLETLLSTLNMLVGKADKLLISFDKIVERINDPSTTVGAMLGSSELYDMIVKEMKQVSVTMDVGRDLLERGNQIEMEVQNSLPRILGNADTMFTSVKTMSVDLEQVVAKLNGVASNVEHLLVKVNGMMDEGEDKMEDAGELIDAVSDFWFIKGKIQRQNTQQFPLLEGGFGP